jgi:sugar lactone lactonase YvrE
MARRWQLSLVAALVATFASFGAAEAHFGHVGHSPYAGPDDFEPAMLTRPGRDRDPVTIAAFTPPDLPTGHTIDKDGDIFLSMGITGEVRKIARNGHQSTVTTFNTGFFTQVPCCAFLGALAVDDRGDIYALLASFNAPGADTHGVWRIRQNGTKSLVTALPTTSLPHAMAFDRRGDLYVTDAFLGRIWRVTPQGQLSVWMEHPLFMPDPNNCPPLEGFPEGLGGIAFDQQGDVYVTNLNKATILHVPVRHGGIPGPPRIVAGPDCTRLEGIDGIALDVQGNIYVASELKNTVMRVSQRGEITTLVTPDDNTDAPHSVAFGTVGGDKKNLYFANLALSALLGNPTPRPSLMTIDVGVPGLAVPR